MSAFRTVEQAQQHAKRRLPRSVYRALLAGSEQGITVADNDAAFDELVLPSGPVLTPPREHDLTTVVLGQRLSMPLVIAPTGTQAVHPDGELAVARAAATRGLALGLSEFASRPIEQVVAAGAPTFFQVHWSGSRGELAHRLDRARTAGAAGVILTLDWSFSEGRDWGSPVLPDRLNVATMLRFAPGCLARPRWLARWAGSLPTLDVPNQAEPGRAAPTFFGAYRHWQQSPPPSWDDVGWLRRQWDGHFLVKGITRADDARRAVDAGATAVSVSNHGGNNLDTTPASIRLLPAVADAVGHEVEVLVDGGIRRGSDIVKAVALGARAVMLGRAYLWGLAADGQAGVENVLDILAHEMHCELSRISRTLAEVDESIIVPKGFSPLVT